MTAVSGQAFVEQRFVVAPHVMASVGSSRLVWPFGGNPAVLDQASATIFDCFAAPLSPAELAEDMTAALGLDRDVALRAAATTTLSLRNAGHLIAEGEEPMPSWRLDYPPSSSP